MLLDDLGNRIRERRKKLDLKQDDIARALQISPQAVSKWERGENAPDLAILGPLARLLGVSVDWLLGVHSDSLDVFEATVFVSSVPGAYHRSTHMNPRTFATWANGIFYQLTEIMVRFDGVPLKYMGDEFLGFFSGVNHRERALKAAFLAKQAIDNPLSIGLSSGEVYLGPIGHPDYAQSDIMGETVNIAFLTMNWADANLESRLGVTEEVLAGSGIDCKKGDHTKQKFKDIDKSVCIVELIPPDTE